MVGRSGPKSGRVDRNEFDSAATLGAALNLVIEALARDFGPDFLDHRRDMSAAQRAVSILEFAVRMTYASGLPAVFEVYAEFVEETPGAAELIGAPAYAEVFALALAALPPDARVDWQRRSEFLAENPEALDHLDDEFYALEDSGDVLPRRIVDFIEAHSDEFLA